MFTDLFQKPIGVGTAVAFATKECSVPTIKYGVIAEIREELFLIKTPLGLRARVPYHSDKFVKLNDDSDIMKIIKRKIGKTDLIKS